MGASGWSYFTPFQADVEAALQKLRQEVFEKKEFGQARTFAADRLEGIPAEAREKIILLNQQMGELETEQMEAGTIDDALEAAAESGTHSILDIIKISPVPDFAVAWQAPEELVEEVFGTVTPDHKDISEHEMELSELLELERWQAVYVIVYEQGKPSEIYFEGVSGD